MRNLITGIVVTTERAAGVRRGGRRRCSAAVRIALGCLFLLLGPLGASPSRAQEEECLEKTAFFITGFSGSSADNPGVHSLADDLVKKGLIPAGAVRKVGHSDAGSTFGKSDAAKEIAKFKKRCPNAKVILVGHSYGGDSAIETAQDLQQTRGNPDDRNIAVDLLVQIDSVGVGDEVLPDNVAKGVNIWSTSRDGINGAEKVEGSTNIGIDGATHTNIDDGEGQSSQEGYEGKNALQIVEDEVSKVQSPYRPAVEGQKIKRKKLTGGLVLEPGRVSALRIGTVRRRIARLETRAFRQLDRCRGGRPARVERSADRIVALFDSADRAARRVARTQKRRGVSRARKRRALRRARRLERRTLRRIAPRLQKAVRRLERGGVCGR